MIVQTAQTIQTVQIDRIGIFYHVFRYLDNYVGTSDRASESVLEVSGFYTYLKTLNIERWDGLEDEEPKSTQSDPNSL
jgi:hypothetical protein